MKSINHANYKINIRPQGQFNLESVAVDNEANGQMNIARRINLA